MIALGAKRPNASPAVSQESSDDEPLLRQRPIARIFANNLFALLLLLLAVTPLPISIYIVYILPSLSPFMTILL